MASSIGIAAYQSIKNDYLAIDTDAQHILTYLIAHLNEKYLVPVREIFDNTGIPVNTFEDSVQQLKEMGLIEDITGGFRALKVTMAGGDGFFRRRMRLTNTSKTATLGLTSVVPLCERAITTSPRDTRPRSPCSASPG